MGQPLARGFVFALLLVAGAEPSVRSSSWKPVDPAELALAAPKIDPAADVEILLWEVRITNEQEGGEIRSNHEQYLRVKIFTDRGRDAFARVDIPYLGHVRVSGVEARAVKPDGTTTELNEADVHERDIVRAGGVKVKAVSFGLPGVERGGIVEFRWRESRKDELLNYRLPFAREYPAHRVLYRVKPLPLKEWRVQLQPFRGRFDPLREDGDYYVISASGVPAFREEPHSPPQWDLRPWVLVCYTGRTAKTDAREFWTALSRAWWDESEKLTTPTPGIRAAAREAVTAAGSLDAKVSALLKEARARIRRTDVSPASTGEEKKQKAAKHAGEAFERGEGTGLDLANVFVAMARAVDLDARLAFGSSRDDIPFDARLMLTNFLVHRLVAVRDGSSWRFLDPANHFDPSGRLRWTQEGEAALIPDKETLTTVLTPGSGPEWSVLRRTAKLALAEDGTLEGDMRCEYHGHLGLALKDEQRALSEEERSRRLRELLAGRLPSAELTQVAIDHAADAEGPYTQRYHMRVPGYAQRTGSRLFLQPSVFEKNAPPEFPSATRVNQLWFEHPWSEHDEVSISLPPGFALESPDAPRDTALVGIGRLSAKLTRAPDDSRIDFIRDFVFGEGRQLTFQPAGYAPIKAFFDSVQKHSEHALTLRRKEVSR